LESLMLRFETPRHLRLLSLVCWEFFSAKAFSSKEIRLGWKHALLN